MPSKNICQETAKQNKKSHSKLKFQSKIQLNLESDLDFFFKLRINVLHTVNVPKCSDLVSAREGFKRAQEAS